MAISRTPARIAVDPLNGDLYVSDNGNSRIEVFNPEGTYVTKFGSAGKAEGQFESLKSIAISPSGTIYTADAGNERVEEWVTISASVTKSSYDAAGNLATQTDPNGNSTHYTYDADNEPTKLTEPNGVTKETAYDADGEVVGETEGAGHATTYTRNVLEQVTTVSDPLGRETKKEYNKAGNLETQTDAEGRTTTYAYNSDNELTAVSYSDGKTPDVKYEYNADGRRTSMTDGTGTSIYAYDELDRLTESKNGHGDTISYEYDLANEPTKIVYPNGKAVTRAYDSAGRLHSVTDWLERTTTFSYNLDSNLTATTFPSGTGDRDQYTYNDADRMTEVRMTKGSETLASIAYARDPDGQVTNAISSGLPGEPLTSYQYDEHSRLIRAGGTAYEYDGAGNPTRIGTTSNTFDAADELISGTGATHTYNEEGERVTTTPTSGPATTYTYNQAGDLTSLVRPEEGSTPKIEDTYAYNGDGIGNSRTISGRTTDMTWDTAEGDTADSTPLLLSDGTDSYIYGSGNMAIEQITTKAKCSIFTTTSKGPHVY